MTLPSWSKSPSLPREDVWLISSSLSDVLPSASCQSVHAAGMSDRLPFGRMTSTSNTPRTALPITHSSGVAQAAISHNGARKTARSVRKPIAIP